MAKVDAAQIQDAPFEGEPPILVLNDFGTYTVFAFPLYKMPVGYDLNTASSAWQVFWIQMFTIQAERARWD